MSEVHLELLLGQPVVDIDGQTIGRIEEIRAEPQGEDWIIQEYLVGSTALFERLSAWYLGIGLLKLLGAHKIHAGYRIPWDQLDLSNPERPRLRCSRSQLQALNQQLEQAVPPSSSD